LKNGGFITCSDPAGLDYRDTTEELDRGGIVSSVQEGRGICLLNVTYKVLAEILYGRLLLHANARSAVPGWVPIRQINNRPTLCTGQILEKCNEFNITTHHLFIDFKAAYDTIIRNEVYVGMSELNFSTKFERLTKATLTIVTYCVKIQTDCSESYETRIIYVLSTLLFNVVLEVIVRRANQQTTGTIYNKETYNCSYLRGRFSERYAARKSKMVSSEEGATTNSIESLTARMP
jgi:hypothetical protein